jgi:hypothetical protein
MGAVIVNAIHRLFRDVTEQDDGFRMQGQAGSAPQAPLP